MISTACGLFAVAPRGFLTYAMIATGRNDNTGKRPILCELDPGAPRPRRAAFSKCLIGSTFSDRAQCESEDFLIIFPFRPHSGVRWRGFSTWIAIDDDPSFIVSFGLFRPRFLVISLEGLTGAVDPVLYLDHGEGFSETDTVVLETCGRTVCVVALRSLPRLRRIRIDPASRRMRFRISVKASLGPIAVRRHLAHASRWQDPSVAGATRFSHLGEDPLWSELPGRKLAKHSFLSVADHYEKVVGLAALRQPARPGAPAPERKLISFVVPAYDTPLAYLRDLLTSFRIQDQNLAELVLSDDGSTAGDTMAFLEAHRDDPNVVILRHDANRGIAAATNAGIAAARGEWVGFLDHDDALAPHGVAVLAEAIATHPDAKFVYTDEVIANKSLQPTDYSLKPAFDPVLLSGVNYINHLSLFRRDRLVSRGGLREGFQGSQDYDLLLRYLDGLARHEILHVPYPAYLWRRDGKSFSASFMEKATAHARKALASHYQRDGREPPVDAALTSHFHRVRFDLARTSRPRVSVILPNRDSYPLIARILADLETKTDYPDLEIIVIDNGSTDPRVLDLYRAYAARHPATIIAIEPEPFNFSRSINKGVSRATGELVLLLNNDIEVIEPGWLAEMASCFAYPGTGIVGARLLYPNQTIQHAGVIIGLGGLAGHWFGGKPPEFPGPMGRLHVRQSLSAVTGACMLVSRACLDATGRFDEEEFAIAYNDIDFCLRAGQRGYRVVWTPFATLVHHESASRGSDDTPQNIARFKREQGRLDARHFTKEFDDPAFNPWYTRDRSVPGIVLLDHLPKART